MAEYIEREALLKFIENGINNPDRKEAFGYDAVEILEKVQYMPAADVVHVVHAEWRLDGFCTNCGYRADVQSIGFNCTGGTRIEYKRTKFCPECGAKMDGDMENNRQAEVIR